MRPNTKNRRTIVRRKPYKAAKRRSVMKLGLYKNAAKTSKYRSKIARTTWLANKVLGIDGLRENIVSFMPNLTKRVTSYKGRPLKRPFTVRANNTNKRQKSAYWFPTLKPAYKWKR
jgi:hypothetical protein